MKKILFIFLMMYLVIGSSLISTNAKVITDTGHSDIIELEFKNPWGYRLLNEYTSEELDEYYHAVPKNAFGWSAYAMTEEAEVRYVSEIIFSKVNRTSSPLVYKYNLKNQETKEYIVSTAGSLALKFSGKIKGVSTSIDSDLKRDVTKKTKSVIEEKTSFEVNVPVGKKVTLRVSGDATLSNGVGKFYFMGIPLKKGTWEYINKLTEYYELYEENI